MNVNVDNNKGVWLGYDYLRSNGVSENTIKKWCNRKIGIYKKDSNRTYIFYDSIPERTRSKLPPKPFLLHDAGTEEKERAQSYFYKELKEAYDSPKSGHWRNEILKEHEVFDSKKFSAKLNGFARKAAVFERILSIYKGKKGELESLHKAYLQLFPDGYSMKNRFCMAIKQAKEKGVLSVAVNGSCLNRGKVIHGDVHRYHAFDILSNPKGFDTTDAYETFIKACECENIAVPSFKWFWTFRKNNLNNINRGRLGATQWEAGNGTRAKIIPALYAGDQWQIDGWRIPLWGKKRNENGKTETFVDYILFAVMDAHSRKIIGFHIAESENTEMILNGLEMAIKDTKTLPHEIVSDNHSFHKTKEAENLKKELSDMGVIWSVSMNPRRKGILERAFRTLGDKHFKKVPGYIGQGIRSKIETGITQPELMSKYAKPENMYTREQIVEVAACLIDKYNNSLVKKLNDTPKSRYDKSNLPHAKRVDDTKRIRLFFPKTEHTIRHGQVTLRQGEHIYEYQLSAEFSGKYNNQKVGVRYEDTSEIYLYDLETDDPICTVKQKVAIYGALANQTENDTVALNKLAGRKKGIDTRDRKETERIIECGQALLKMGAHQRVNKLTTNKEMQMEIRNNTFLRLQIQERFGFDVGDVPDLPMLEEMPNPAFKPKKAEENRNPFHGGKGTMEKLTIDINN